MSTSTLGREDRKPLEDAFVFQRRILLGCSAAIGVSVIVYLVAISTNSWCKVTTEQPIFQPETGKYFLKSYSGIWEMCITTIDPQIDTKSLNARNFTNVGVYNKDEIKEIKDNISKMKIIDEYLKPRPSSNVTVIDEQFKQQLFAHWIRTNQQFNIYKKAYKLLMKNSTIDTKGRKFEYLQNPSNLTEIKEKIGPALTKANLNNNIINVIIPMQIQDLLITNFTLQKNFVLLLPEFAKKMEISQLLVGKNKTKIILQPPSEVKNGYNYHESEFCDYHELFPTEGEESDLDDELINYTRTEATFSCLTILVMTMGFFFSLYTFLNPRYMFKRLAGGIHFISASTNMVVCQVFAHDSNYAQDTHANGFPVGSKYTFGYGFYLVYIVFAVNLFSALTFMWNSRKKKGEKAPTEELGMCDEAINIGR